MTLVPGTRVGPYEILLPLGKGGMGEVFRARDTRLGREVAVKLLSTDLATDPEQRKRFEQEVRAAAALNHSGILAVHDVGDYEGRPYLVTELLEGETLRERLNQGKVPARKAAAWGAEMASALAAAHEQRVIHRDLKPENLFVTTEGRIKILDFGLAKMVPTVAAEDTASAKQTAFTEPGTVLGTVGYMSPEQIRGEAVDHRTDIFSLGCVLYEMLAGQRAFEGPTAADTITAVLSKDPPPLSASEREIPTALPGIVSQCLEKRSSERFSNAHDLALALRLLAEPTDARQLQPVATAPVTSPWRRMVLVGLAAVALVAVVTAGWKLLWRTPAAHHEGTEGRSVRVVVLPFENLGAPEDAYFTAGMAEEITSRLANVQGVRVISRTSAVGYDRKGKTIRQIGSDLGVDYVLEGSVRWERDPGRESRVRITPQLSRVADDTQIWSDRYERVLADVFAIQSEVAESAVKEMGLNLLPREQTALKEVSTNDLEAYDLYLRARELDSRGFDRKDIEGALQMYQAAIDHDPGFAQALAGLARENLMMYWEYYDRSQERLARARMAAERAVELHPDLAEAHIALGMYYYQGLLNYPQAVNEFTAALKAQPNSGDAIEGIGFVLRRQGRWAEAEEMFSKVAELDPKNASRLFNVGDTFEIMGRYADADRAYMKTLALNPQWGVTYGERAWTQLLWHGDAEKAQAILDQAAAVVGLSDESGYLAWRRLQIALARRDYPGALRQLQTETHGGIDNQDIYAPVPLLHAQVYRLAGQQDLAHHSFESARLDLEKKIKEDPDDYRFHSALAIAYAGIGRSEEAVREARRGCDLMPASKDALRAIDGARDLAVVYTMVGRRSDAINALDDLLGRSGWINVCVLRLDPTWDPLRQDPRFRALLTKYEVQK